MQTQNSILKFNNRHLPFTVVDGTAYIALKPICESLGINFDRQYKNLKKDSVLSGVYAVQPMRDSENRMRNYVALPEFYIYGWLFTIRSDSAALQEYKLKCYKILWNYFQGSIAERKKVLQQKAQVQAEMSHLRDQLRADEKYQRLNELQGQHLKLCNILKRIDEEEQFKQLAIFNGS